MNKVILIGRLTKDAEFKQIAEKSKDVLNCTLAVNRDYLNDKGEKGVDFIPVVYWSKSGDVLAGYMKKGRLVSVTGRINVRSYETKEGSRRYVTEILADKIEFLDSQKDMDTN